jgi:hypothetical protein
MGLAFVGSNVRRCANERRASDKSFFRSKRLMERKLIDASFSFDNDGNV